MNGTDGRVMRADLHVHSYHSGYTARLPFLRARDCYSEPEAVHAVAKARGMDIVTITDHDSIDGCLEFLERHPDAGDFFISEEIESRFPDTGLKVHIAAYGIDERIHRDIQPLRSDVFQAAAYLRSEGVFYALNHPFLFFRNQMPFARYLDAALELFPALEVRNGTMLPAHNRLASAIAVEPTLPGVPALVAIGGSDSHTLSGVGTTYTEAPASNRDEFLRSLHAGRARVGGRHGNVVREAREIYGVVGRYWASLLGVGRQELSWQRRILGLAFSAISVPGQFIPLLFATLDKRAEARRVASYRREWELDRLTRVGKHAPLPSDRFGHLLTGAGGSRQ
jgi:predicted metal-dependent phosphoesterase TrpH